VPLDPQLPQPVEICGGLEAPPYSQHVSVDCRLAPEQPEASVLRALDLRGVAPAFVLTAEYDVLRNEGEAYARRLLGAGVPVTLTRYEGQIHGFLRMPAVIERAREAIDQVAESVRAALLVPVG